MRLKKTAPPTMVSLALAAAAIVAIAAAPHAAAQGNRLATPLSTPNADRLAEQMRVLAREPTNLAALIAAGELSVTLGDPAAALGFFARGEAIAPGDSRLLAGRASALTALERPGEAMRLFDAAVRAGYPEAQLAAQRGLAYDLLGHPGHAQRDYRLALRAGENDEVTRRLALSLGISGDVAESTRVLDPLLRRNDRAAWRARAFILAINGDVAGADRIAAGLLPGFGASVSPFFRRLAALDASGRAFAVHFGQLTATPARLADAALSPPISPLSAGEVRMASRAADPAPNRDDRDRRPRGEGRRRAEATVPDTPTRQRASAPLVAAAPSGTGSIASALRRRDTRPAGQPPLPARVAPPFTVGAPQAAPDQATPIPSPPAPVAVAANTAPAVASAPVAAPPTPVAPTPDTMAAALSSTPAAAAPAPVVDRAANRAVLAEIVARLTDGATEAETPAAAPSPAVPVATPAPPPMAVPKPVAARPRTPPVKSAPVKPDPTKLEPARHWVQVAGGANKADLPKVWDKLVKQAPAQFRGKRGWTTPLRATNRLLAGPFASAREAQAFVNELGKAGLSAFAWQSEAGQKIERLRQ